MKLLSRIQRRRDASRHADESEDKARVRLGNRRRLLVFGVTFAALLLAGQAWNFSRQADYRASTRLQVVLPEVGRAGLSATGGYATKLQLFDSKPMLGKLANALVANGLPASTLGADPAGRLQSMLLVKPVQGSEIVELQAIGPEPQLLADMLNTFPQVVRTEIAARQKSEADAQLGVARQELARLERTASERRARLEAFRQRAGVSADREDNDAVARTKGLHRALDLAEEKEAAAAARLAAVTKAVEQGKSSTQVRADTALSGLESRAYQVREDIKELERSYTPEYLAMDPRARALRARLVELESQIVRQRTASLQAALQSAQEDQATAQAQVERLRAQLSASRPALTKTTTRFGEAKVLEDDLAQVDKARRDLLERVARLEADEQRRVAVVSVVEAATVPTRAFRPDYGLDAALVLAGAAAIGLIVMGIVEAFNRPPAATPTTSTTLVLTPGWGDAQARLGDQGPAPPEQLSAAAQRPLIAPAPAAPIRVLSQPEAAALLTAADGPSRFLCATALMGLSIDEALRIRPRDVDAAAARLSVGGPWARSLPLPAWLPDAVAAGPDAEQAVLRDATGQALSAADVASIVISAALDAGLEHATSVSWDVLRNTNIDWLVGQGLRYTDLPKLVGRVDAQMLQSLSARHGETKRRDLGEIDLLMPALQVDPSA
jgi:uncharacterized protein involved in exopolysaccharide biosynthesis